MYKSFYRHRSLGVDEDVISLPFYGGGKGQVLQIHKQPDGSVFNKIVKQTDAERKMMSEIEEEIKENQEDSSFDFNLKAIQKAATELVKLQQSVKNSGKMTPEAEQLYAIHLEKLGVSAQKLAHLQKTTGHDDFKLLFQGICNNLNFLNPSS